MVHKFSNYLPRSQSHWLPRGHLRPQFLVIIKRFNFDMYVTNDCNFSEEGVDFSIGPVMVTFGPCDPCTSNHLRWEAQLCVKDDDDLEFEHGLIIDLASTDPSGITAGDPLQITITDDGNFLYQNTRPLFSSLFSQSNLQLV